MLLEHAIHCAAGKPVGSAPVVPLICMPGSAEDARPMFDRLVEVAQVHLSFPALLVAPDLAEPNAMETWPAALAELAGRYDLAERGLVFGHGAGARHAQHFALENPASVIACAALSADAWASAEDAPEPTAVRPVRWLIGCGTDEPGHAMRRAEQLQVELAEVGCGVDLLDWDGAPVELPGHALENAARFFNDLQSDVKRAA